MKSFKQQYNILNPKQKQAVDSIEGPVFVMAGPGTGKTQILTLRIANIIKQGNGIEPENILALTFTNAAAYNMRERLSKIIGAEQAHRVYISTFHSFAEDMIKRHREYFDRFGSSRLISPVEQIELLSDLSDRVGGESFSVFKRRASTIKSIAFSIGKIKGEALSPDEFRTRVNEQFKEDMQSPDMFYKRAYGEFKKGDLKPQELRALEKKRDKTLSLADIYEAYEQDIRDKELYDYSDLIISVVRELKSESLFQTELQEQFQYILVDEHQDTNDGQNEILRALIDNPVWEGKPNIFVVGDSKQSIFRFAGASESSFTELFSNLKEVITIELEHNYRSDQKVLDRAQSLITKSHHHKQESKLEAFFDYEASVEYREFHNYKTEALFVAQDIKQRIDHGEDPEEIAILFRNNKDIEEIRTLLAVYDIPYHDFSKKNLLKDADMKKLFIILRCIHDITDDEMLAKALFIDFFEFSLLGVQKVLKAYRGIRGAYKSLFEMISSDKKLKELGFSDDEQVKYKKFVMMLEKQFSLSKNTDFISFFSQCIRETGFLKSMLSYDNSVYALGKIETLFDEIKKESSNRKDFSVKDFINYLNTLIEHDIALELSVPMIPGVQLMTFHGSKGLEFETVYIVRALAKRKQGSEISLPFDNFQDGELEDERRLMYVAITRAKKNCLLSSYIHNHEGKAQSRSIHINEIDDLSHLDMSLWEQEHAQDFADFFGESHEYLQSLLNQEYLEERFLKTKLSVSALNNYMQSPLLYYFRNLVLLPQARSPFLDFGNLIHGTLEDYFNLAKRENSIPSKEIFKELFEKKIHDNYIYEDYRDKGWKLLSAYFDRYEAEFEIPLENEFRIPAVSFESTTGHIINLTGVVDKITRDKEGNISVWDYKTGRSYSSMDKGRKEKIKRQAVFYKLLLQHSFSGKYNFRSVVFDFLEPNEKTGEHERMTFNVTQDDVEELKSEINTLVEDIFSGKLLDKDFSLNPDNRDLLDFLDVLKGPRSYEQPSLLN